MNLDTEQLTGKTCAELGASPGGWTWVLLNHGCKMFSVDWAPLRPDLIEHPNMISHQLGDARVWFTDFNVYMVVADLSMPPETSLEVLERWVTERKCEKLIWTIKFSYLQNSESRRGRKRETGKYLSRQVTVVKMVKQLMDQSSYSYSIRNLYKHGQEVVLLAGLKS